MSRRARWVIGGLKEGKGRKGREGRGHVYRGWAASVISWVKAREAGTGGEGGKATVLLESKVGGCGRSMHGNASRLQIML